MSVCRALPLIEGTFVRNQRWAVSGFLGCHSIVLSGTTISSSASSGRRGLFRSFITTSTNPCGDLLRKNPSYSYDRLNWAASEIRLIEILPQQGHEDNAKDEPVACCIHHFSLNDHPDYLALSYAWGDITRTESLILNNQIMKITTSLDTALRQLRHLIKNGGLPSSTRIWIDAVSINQEDEVEKTWQVRQMGQIYQNAEYTLVWLGSASEASARALTELDRIGKIDDIHLDDLGLSLMGSSPESNIFPIGALLTDLFRQTWWERIWVVQEFAFGQNVLFMCGDTMVWWQPLFKALDLLKQLFASIAVNDWEEGMRDGNHRRLMDEISTIHNISRLFYIREKLKNDGERLSMWELLALKRSGMRASDSRDLVYALTGLSKDAASKMLYPDYSRDVQHVYIETARAFLMERRLRLLWFASQPRVLPDLPSWVPDWSAAWRDDYRYLSEDGGYGQPAQVFWAAGNSQPVISFSGREGNTLLHMQGYEFDTILDTKSVFDMSSIPRAGAFHGVDLAIADRGRALLELIQKHLTVEDEDYNAIIRTTVTDIALYKNSDGSFRHCRARPDFIREIHDLVFPRTEHQESARSRRLYASRLHVIYRHIARRPFITSRGHLGLGPADMLPGDTVVVFFGAELPLILRQDNNRCFQVVGEAYVHGAMDGEGMAMGFKSKSFDIR